MLHDYFRITTCSLFSFSEYCKTAWFEDIDMLHGTNENDQRQTKDCDLRTTTLNLLPPIPQGESKLTCQKLMDLNFNSAFTSFGTIENVTTYRVIMPTYRAKGWAKDWVNNAPSVACWYTSGHKTAVLIILSSSWKNHTSHVWTVFQSTAVKARRFISSAECNSMWMMKGWSKP